MSTTKFDQTPRASTKQRRGNYPLGLVKVIFAIVAALPLSVSRSLGKLAARIVWWRKLRAARTTLQNIKHCYPDWDELRQQRFAKESLAHTGQALFETPAVWRGSIPRIRKWIKGVEGGEAFEQAASDSGALVIPLHFGNWEFLTIYLTTVAPFLGVYSAERMLNLQPFITESRSRSGAEFVEANLKGMLKVRRHLSSQGVVAIFPDQIPDTGGVVIAPLFGQPAKTGTAVLSLLRKTKLPAFLAATRRVSGGFEIRLTEPKPAIFSEDNLVSATALNESIEEAIQIDPAQYQWEYKRYRGTAEIYQ